MDHEERGGRRGRLAFGRESEFPWAPFTEMGRGGEFARSARKFSRGSVGEDDHAGRSGPSRSDRRRPADDYGFGRSGSPYGESGKGDYSNRDFMRGCSGKGDPYSSAPYGRKDFGKGELGKRDFGRSFPYEYGNDSYFDCGKGKGPMMDFGAGEYYGKGPYGKGCFGDYGGMSAMARSARWFEDGKGKEFARGFGGFGREAYKDRDWLMEYGPAAYFDYFKGCGKYGKGFFSEQDMYGDFSKGFAKGGWCNPWSWFAAYGGKCGCNGWGCDFNGKGGPHGPMREQMQNSGPHHEARPSTARGEHLVHLRGLPFKATEADIMQFLGPHGRSLRDGNSIRILRNEEGQFAGRPSGIALVQFSSSSSAKAACEDLNMKHIADPGGGQDRYVEVSYSTSEKRDLVDRVKDLQKNSRENSQKWYAYCEQKGTDAYDPNRHDEDFIRGFLDAFEQEVVFQPAGGANLEEDNNDCSILLRGVPFQASVVDIRDFIGKHQGALDGEDAVKLVYNQDGPFRGRPSGAARATFSSTAAAKVACDDLNMKHMKDPGGGEDRYIEVFHISSGKAELVRKVKDLQKFSRENRDKWHSYCEKNGAGEAYDPNRHDEEFLQGFLDTLESELDNLLAFGREAHADDSIDNECTLTLRGLPFRAGIPDIKQFLGEHDRHLYTGDEDAIRILYNQDGPFAGRPSGIAKVRFTSMATAQAASRELNMRNIEDPGGGPDRWVEVMEMADRNDHAPAGNMKGPWEYDRPGGKPSGAYVEDGDAERIELIQRIKEHQRASHDNRDRWYTYCDRQGTSCHDPARHSAEFLRGFLDKVEMEVADALPDPIDFVAEEDEEDNTDGCTVTLRGLPFRATAADIIKFLGVHARQLKGDRSIRTVINKEGPFRGRPSGVARVRFVSLEAAKEAYNDLDKRNMADPAGGPERWVEVLLPREGGHASPDFPRREGVQLPKTDPSFYGPSSSARTDPSFYGPSSSMSRQRGMDRYEPYHGAGRGMNELNPWRSSDLVERVKELQRDGAEYRQMWYDFCDQRGTSCHDPSRHPPEFLNSFLRAYETGAIRPAGLPPGPWRRPDAGMSDMHHPWSGKGCKGDRGKDRGGFFY